METSAGILAIGNEVVEGQIVNRNAAWLAEQLDRLGIRTRYHLSCRDVEKEITDSLNFLSNDCDLILVSGGLGPTRDDCTRQSLAVWTGSDLETNQAQWLIIEKKLKDRNVTVREGHKRQALLPKGAVCLPNDRGVAPGFFLKAPKAYLASLPGPPNELQPMFEDYLEPLLTNELKPKKESELKTLICFGAPESEVAHVVESILSDRSDYGFRLHRPYVEVKIWIPLERPDEFVRKLSLIREKLRPWLVGESIAGIRGSFHKKLLNYDKVYVSDHLTSGLFLERLQEVERLDHLRYQCFEHKSFRYFSREEVLSIFQSLQTDVGKNELFLSLFPAADNKAFICFNSTIHTIELPRRIPVTSKLGQLYVVESCFLKTP